jgi:hypothetical protein
MAAGRGMLRVCTGHGYKSLLSSPNFADIQNKLLVQIVDIVYN